MSQCGMMHKAVVRLAGCKCRDRAEAKEKRHKGWVELAGRGRNHRRRGLVQQEHHDDLPLVQEVAVGYPLRMARATAQVSTPARPPRFVEREFIHPTKHEAQVREGEARRTAIRKLLGAEFGPGE